jgi:hypothetical protein
MAESADRNDNRPPILQKRLKPADSPADLTHSVISRHSAALAPDSQQLWLNQIPLVPSAFPRDDTALPPRLRGPIRPIGPMSSDRSDSAARFGTVSQPSGDETLFRICNCETYETNPSFLRNEPKLDYKENPRTIAEPPHARSARSRCRSKVCARRHGRERGTNHREAKTLCDKPSNRAAALEPQERRDRQYP